MPEAQFDIKSAIEAIKKQKTVAEVKATFDVVAKDYAVRGIAVPVEIHGAMTDRIAAIEAK